MKKILLFLLFGLFIQGCNQVTPKEKEDGETIMKGLLQKVKDEQKASGKISNEICLGLKLGMSERTVNSRLFKLLDSGTVFTKNGAFYYPMVLNGVTKVDAVIKPSFIDDSLYLLNLVIKPNSSTQELYFDLDKLYESKYGGAIFMWQRKFDSEYERHWVDGNREIIITIFEGDGIVSYQDWIKHDREIEKNNAIEDLKKEKTKQDI